MGTTANITTTMGARAAGIATALLVLAAVVVALALPSEASAGRPRCASGAFCMWMNSGYDGPKYVAFGSRRVLAGARYRRSRFSVTGSVSSFINNGRPGRSAVRLFYFGSSEMSSPSICIPPLGRAVNLDFWPIDGLKGKTWNDNIRGLQWVSSC